MTRHTDHPLVSDRKGHVANVVALRPAVAPNPNHPCMYDGRGDPLPLAMWQRQLLAGEVLGWKSDPPTGERIDSVVALLLGTDPEVVA